jgi:hypothetical protein
MGYEDHGHEQKISDIKTVMKKMKPAILGYFSCQKFI